MSESQWWLYDLVVLAIAVLCIWNGVSRGIFRAIGGFLSSIAACLLAWLIATPIAEMTYDAFFQDSCQSLISQELEKLDVTEDVRNYLGQNGIYLPYSDEEIAQMIRSVNEDKALADQTAAYFGMDGEQLREYVGEAVIDAVQMHDELIPDWAEAAIAQTDEELVVDAVADTASSLFSNDYQEAAISLEASYVRPAVVSLLSVVVFAAAAFLISLLLRVILLVLPSGRNCLFNQLMGGLLGLLKTGVYLYLIVMLVSCIASMQNGEYPFFSEETINQTCIFRLLYDAFVR